MRKHILLLLLSLAHAAAAQTALKPYGVTPSARQLRWHEMEQYALIHFTPTTFENKEWGFGDADPKIFNPINFDAGQIVQAAKDGGLKGVIFVAKHHDGYCLWPTKTTPYNITKSPWRKGKGDMVREMATACRQRGMQFGVYCSPWDRNHPAYGTEAYVKVFRQQLTELYSNYGPLFISWFDGANGGDGYYGGAKEIRTIDKKIYYNWADIWKTIVRKRQPNAVIFSDIGPDVRWVGNEHGHAAETHWATFTPVAEKGGKATPGDVDTKNNQTGTRNGQLWTPAECDVPLRKGWFYHATEDEHVKQPDQLFDLYLKSVGRGACLDLGLAPTPEGRLHPNDVAALKAYGQLIQQTFSANLAKLAKITPNITRKGCGVAALTDSDRYSYWATPDSVHEAELLVEWAQPKPFNLIQLRENIKLGQRLEYVKVEAWQDDHWETIGEVHSVGANRLIKLPYSLTVPRVRITLKAPVALTLSQLGFYQKP